MTDDKDILILNKYNTYTNMHAYTYTCIQICVDSGLHACVHTETDIYRQPQSHTYANKHLRVFVDVNLCMCEHIHTYKYERKDSCINDTLTGKVACTDHAPRFPGHCRSTR